ncbi:IclR family transcriptional regulator [Cytobacillus kochii]|uniref:IclR family transcriptional regulator n=1 Tax=Cytobacillus kochii TaxID=859143 RepID=UPI002E21EC4D|nr:IclR family transcriptional regulator [Cytobacillus kochii]
MSSKTVSKALAILNAFTIEKPTWGLRELSRYLDMSHTIVHRILITFQENGYIVHDPDTQKYQLGIKFIELSHVVQENLNISNMLEPIMEKIAHKTGESVALTILDNEEGLYVKIVESQQNVRFSETVGRRSPLYIGASHKVIMAYLSDEIQRKIIQVGIDENSPHIISLESFMDKMKQVRIQGWFYTANETFSDVSAVAIPLFDGKKHILGSLSVAGPSYRLTEEKANEVLQTLREYQKDINLIFGKVFLPSKRNYLIKEGSLGENS